MLSLPAKFRTIFSIFIATIKFLRPLSKLMSPDPRRLSRMSVHNLVKQKLCAQMLHVRPQHVPEYQVLP